MKSPDSSAMEYRRLGRSGIKVSVLSFGSWVTFGGQLVFQKEGTILRWLHNQTCAALQRRLAFHGQPMVILPVRVY